MKNTTLALAILALVGSSSAQTYEHKWNVGIHGGGTHYNGDLGNGFYKFDKAFYGFAGLSVSRYLNRHWDASLYGTRGTAGYFGPWNPDPTVPTNFLTNLTTVNLHARYKFLDPKYIVTPFAVAGAGILFQNGVGDSYIDRGKKFDFAPEAGLGVNFRFGQYINLQLMELFMYSSADEVDGVINGLNDMYVFHTVGLTVNLPKLNGNNSSQQSGAGEGIDKCPKMKQHRNKVTKSEGQSLRKEKKSKRKLARKSRKTSKKSKS